MKKHIENMAEEILQEYTNCYSEVDQECLEKMLFKLVSEARADTVKKMQDVVKSKMVTNVLDIKFMILYEEELDQIAKEILEGGDTE